VGPVGNAVLEVLLPRRCGVCRRPGGALCDPCRGALLRVVPPVCERCGTPGPWPVRRCAECAGRRLAFTTARAAIVYDDRARTLVGAWKEHGRRDLAPELAMLVRQVVGAPDADAVCFVPGDRDRSLRRGHVTSEQLARELAAAWNLPLAGLLRRTRSVGPQRGLRLAARRRNLAGVFTATVPVPPRVCLVDDVYTSGSTAAACSAALRRAGARRVDVVTLARAVR